MIERIGLLEIAVAGETPRLTGSEHVSHPIFGERFFVGIEHPVADGQVRDDTLSLSQASHRRVADEWVDFPAAVFGSASDADFAIADKEGLRRAFIRYLDTVRIKPADMHVHYNDWWTAPVPSSKEFVFENIRKLKKGLYDPTGFFFDSYALDMGWSNPHSAWEIDKDHFPDGFVAIRDLLAGMGSRPGLWVSPSSLYPPALDNRWLESEGYEVTPHPSLGLNACLAVGGKYQTAFKEAVLKHARQANLGHVKFDGFVPTCDVASHGHPTGAESYLPIAEGLMEVFDALLKSDPTIALEPTCFGYDASPWWLMHTPFIIGPFGDDSPKGRSPCPEWVEAMTTTRDIKNIEGRDAFLMPSSALQCFDIIVQCPGALQNHAAMAIGRGRWFISCYINPSFVDADEWRFFAQLMAWAKHNREFLQEPQPMGGSPAARHAYGYAFRHATREIYCLRNPWVEETSIALGDSPLSVSAREVRTLYPRRRRVANLKAGEPLPNIHLGPYETKFVEVVASDQRSMPEVVHQDPGPEVSVSWQPSHGPMVEHLVFEDAPPPFGPSWTCPEGDTKESLVFSVEGEIEVKGALTTELSLLCEGESVDVAFPRFEMTIDGTKSPVTIARSVGAFSAGGPTNEDWVWLTTPLPAGKHRVALKGTTVTRSARFGVFLRGAVATPESLPPFGPGPSFPLYHADSRMWSRTLVPLDGDNVAPPKRVARRIDRIDGVYLDALKWSEATAGWRTVQLKRSVKGQTMTMGGRRFYRGIGTHARSRIVYKLPTGYETFAATIGCDQKALAGSVVFVVQGDGKELFRSPVLRATSDP
ncbi:MAG: NPCBM/NEW2 domain-containing protein, partial [Pirellulales bacterium]